MANTVIGASVDIEFKSIKDLKTALSETEKQFKEMVDTFGEGSQQAQQAQKKLASLQDGINQKTEEYNTKVDAAAQTVSALNATVGGLQGALELTGLASEETEKALSKVTAALSIGDAIQNLTEFGPALATTFNTIKTAGVNTFKALRAAIGTTGIGLIVVAAAAIAMYWDDIKEAVTGYNSELDKSTDKLRKHNEQLDKELDKIEKGAETLKAQGKTEEQITQILIKKAEIRAKNDAQIFANLKAQRDAEIAAAKRNYNIVRNITRFAIEAQAAVYRIIGGPLDLLIMTANKVSEVLGFGQITTFSINDEITKMSKNLSEAAAQKLFDPKAVDAEIEAAELAAIESQNKVDQYKNKLAADAASKAKEIADKQKAEAEKEASERMAAEKELTTFLEGEYEKRNNIGKSQLDIEIENIRKSYDEKLALAKKYNLETDQLEIARLGAIATAVNNETKERESALSKSLGNFKAQAPKIANIDKQITINAANEAKIRTEISDAESQNRILITENFVNVLASLDSITGKNTEKSFERSKRLQIAQALINTYLSINKTLSAFAGVPIPGYAIAQAIATGVAGFIQVKKIAETKYQSPKINTTTTAGGTGGMQTEAPLTPGLGATATAQALNAEAINNLGNTALRAYVMNSDIQNNSQRNAYLQRNARIG